MEPVLRAAIVYTVLLVLFRITGARAVGQLTTFDFVLLLIISEAAQNGMVGNNFSLTNTIILVVTLIVIDVALALVKQRAPRVERWLDGMPLVIVERGRPLPEFLAHARLDESDVLTAARRLHGLERMEQIKYAVLERDGDISIIPWDQPAGGAGVGRQPVA